MTAMVHSRPFAKRCEIIISKSNKANLLARKNHGPKHRKDISHSSYYFY